MAQIEKYIPKRINKDVSPGAIERSGDRSFIPGDLVDALNCRYKDFSSGKVGAVKNTPGNVLKSYSLPAGENVCIGSFQYLKENTVIFFIWNSNSNHQVVEWIPGSDTFNTLISGSILNFSLSNYISHGGTIDDYLVWTDGLNPIRKINIQRGRTTGYSAAVEAEICLAAKPPLTAPTHVRATDGTVFFNKVSENNYQFAFQYTYLDGEVSVFSPISKIATGDLFPFKTSSVGNIINVTVNLDAEVIGKLKNVKVAYRIGNSGVFYIFNVIESPVLTSYTVKFTGSESSTAVSAAESAKYFDAIPIKNDALAIIDNRVFLTLNSIGFDVDPSTFSFTAVLESESAVAGRKYLKNGGSYSVGVMFQDRFGNNSFVKKKIIIDVPHQDATIESVSAGIPHTDKKYIAWTLSGIAPAGMKKVQVVLSKNRNQSIYFQTGCAIYGFQDKISDRPEDNYPDNSIIDTDSPEFNTDLFTWNGNIFGQGEEVNSSFFGNPKAIVLRLPSNIPFVPEKGDFIRILTPECVVKNARVNFTEGGILMFTDINPNDQTIMNNLDTLEGVFVEVYRPQSLINDIFYEVGESFDINPDGTFSVTEGDLFGDTYWSPRNPTTSEQVLNFFPRYNFESPPFQGVNVPASSLLGQYELARVETPTAITRPPTTDVRIQPYTMVFDYNKQDADYGRAFTEYADEKKQNLNTVVGYSDPYIQNSNINGLSSFLASNQYSLPVDRTAVTVLVKVSNNLLAIHERNASSLYVGDALIRQGNDFVLAKTVDVIGDDRELQGGYGTINPESVTSVYGYAFWWDALRGAVVQYSNAGLDPISRFGMKAYFRKKGLDYFPYRNTVKISTVFDYLNDELLITFPDVVVDGVTVIAGVTWGFSLIDNEWRTRYAFIPERYSSVNNDLISFKNGGLWLHNQTDRYNNFYGVQYIRSWTFVMNANPGKNKRCLNIHIDGNVSQGGNEDFESVRISTKEGQQTFIPSYEFTLSEDKWNAPVLRDINTQNIPEGRLALRSGDELVSDYFEIEIRNDRTDEAPCNEVNVVFKTEEFST